MPKHYSITVEHSGRSSVDSRYASSYHSDITVVPKSRIQTVDNCVYGGRIAYMDYAAIREASSVERGEYDQPYASFVAAGIRDMNSLTYGSSYEYYTSIDYDEPALLNPSAITANDCSVQITGNGYFATATDGGRTAVRQGVDLLQVIRADGTPEIYKIQTVDTGSPQVAVLAYLTSRDATSTEPTFPANEVVTIRWIQPTFRVGAHSFEYRGRPFAGQLTEGFRHPAKFVAGSLNRASSNALPNREDVALAWGGFNHADGSSEFNGHLFANGGISCRTVEGELKSLSEIINVSGLDPVTVTLNYTKTDSGDPLTPQCYNCNFYGGADSLTFEWSDDHVPAVGQRFTLLIHSSSSTAIPTLTFASRTSGFPQISWRFSGSDHLIPPGSGDYKFEGVMSYYGSDIYHMLMTRTDYT